MVFEAIKGSQLKAVEKVRKQAERMRKKKKEGEKERCQDCEIKPFGLRENRGGGVSKVIALVALSCV